VRVKEDKTVRQVREIEQAKTQQLRSEAAIKQAAAKKTREEADKIIALEIEKIRRDFFLDPAYFCAQYKQTALGYYFNESIGPFRIKEELMLVIRAWHLYLNRSNPFPDNAKDRNYFRGIERQFSFTEVGCFGNPKTVEEANMAVERIKLTARNAAILAVTQYYEKKLNKRTERQAREQQTEEQHTKQEGELRRQDIKLAIEENLDVYLTQRELNG
jgi:hypothetical protein